MQSREIQDSTWLHRIEKKAGYYNTSNNKSGKREVFNALQEKLDFSKDGVKAHKFATTMNNDGKKQLQLPFAGTMDSRHMLK